MEVVKHSIGLMSGLALGTLCYFHWHPEDIEVLESGDLGYRVRFGGSIPWSHMIPSGNANRGGKI